MGAVDDYHGSLDAETRTVFEHIHELARTEFPTAEQATSYGMAALTLNGKPLLATQANAKHLSLYPFSGSVVDAMREELHGYSFSKGTIRFTLAHPLADDLVRHIVRLRAAEIVASPS